MKLVYLPDRTTRHWRATILYRHRLIERFLTDVFDITKVVQTLQDEDGRIDGIAVTIVPADLDGEAEDGGDVHAGRVSVYAG